eukprot:g18342.t1
MKRALLIALLLFSPHGCKLVIAPPTAAPVGRPKGKRSREGSGTPGPVSEAEKRRRAAERAKNGARWRSWSEQEDSAGGGSSAGGSSAGQGGPSGAGDSSGGGGSGSGSGSQNAHSPPAPTSSSGGSGGGGGDGDGEEAAAPPNMSGQRKFLARVKAKISESAPKHVIGKYPFEGLWVHPPDPTMLKTVNLEDHHLRSIFVWIPELSFPHAFPEGRLPCPRCESTTNVIVKGFTQKCSRRAILRDSCCDLVGYFYHCNGCQRKNKGVSKDQRVPESFSSWDSEVLKLLPLFVRESFPFILTRKSAIHLDVLEELTDNLVNGKGFAASRAALEQAHQKTFHTRELKYYNMLLWRRQNVVLPTTARDFGSFSDPDGYDGFVPSTHYLSSSWCDGMQSRPVAKIDKLVRGVEGEASWSREMFCHLRQQGIDGKVLKVDGSHKYVKLVRVFDSGGAGGTKPVYCVMTFFNEFEQVVFQKALQSASLREIKTDVKTLFATRYKGRGFKLPTVLYTDMCCEDRALMAEIFGELRNEGHEFAVDTDLPIPSDAPVFELPPDVTPVGYIRASRETDVVRAGVDKLRREARDSGRAVGLDIEWESIVDLLEDAGLAKTGVGVKGDCTRLQRFYGVEVRNVVDLPGLALQRKVDVGARRSLADLCLHLLGKRLQKEQHLRLSRWNVEKLTEEQLGYAARDAYASFQLYVRISELSDPIFRDAEELHTGDSVRIYTRGGDDCVGEGIIVAYDNETWGSTGIVLAPRRSTRGVKRRWVVRVSVVHVPLAITLYPDETDSAQTQPTAHVADRMDRHVLWDEDRMRRRPANAGDGMRSAPSASATSGHGGGPHVELRASSTTEPNLSGTAGASSARVGDASLSEGAASAGVGAASASVRAAIASAQAASAREATRARAAARASLGAASAASPGVDGLVTPSEPFFAGEFAGVEALSARFGEAEQGASEAEQGASEAGQGASEAKLGEPIDVEQQRIPGDAAAGTDGSGAQDELRLFEAAWLCLRLDPFHAMQRLSKLILKSHGACRAYLARLRDAFFMVHKEDLAGVEEALRLQGMSPEEIEAKKNSDWGYFLQRCRRVIPPPDVLLKRFNLANRIYGYLLDKKTKQPLFRAEAWEAINRLSVHIQAGCLSDPHGVPLYFEAGGTCGRPSGTAALIRLLAGSTTNRCLKPFRG